MKIITAYAARDRLGVDISKRNKRTSLRRSQTARAVSLKKSRPHKQSVPNQDQCQRSGPQVDREVRPTTSGVICGEPTHHIEIGAW